jgi:hypothetical protein
MNTFPASDAELAASWMLDLEDPAERNRLYSGHRARRVPVTTAQGFSATDHTAADAWLVEQWKAATAPAPEDPLAAIKEELDRKFTGDTYTAKAVLDSQSPDQGTTVWRIEYTVRHTGKRVPEFDGLVRRTANGVTYAL